MSPQAPNPQPPAPSPHTRRIGLFGGSFDPIHNGHLLLAECCREQARLDEVWLIPAAVQPHKPRGPIASNEDRCEMIRLAIEPRPGLRCSRIEIDRGGVSYTVDTLREVTADLRGAEFFLLMGADTLRDLPSWREPAEILRLAAPIVVHRAGEPPPDFTLLRGLVSEAKLAEISRLAVSMPPTDISSSQLRERIAARQSIDELTPAKVIEFIERRGLYR